MDDHGRSPFWDALGKHFFDVDFPNADYLSLVNKKFIADLMPKHPIYIPLLPKDAQDVIGKVHEQTEPALKLLEAEGLRDRDVGDRAERGHQQLPALEGLGLRPSCRSRSWCPNCCQPNLSTRGPPSASRCSGRLEPLLKPSALALEARFDLFAERPQIAFQRGSA